MSRDLTLSNSSSMYPREVTLSGKTAHSRYCKRSPNRYDWDCHRCAELMKGAAPRDGWQHEFFRRKFLQRQTRLPF